MNRRRAVRLCVRISFLAIALFTVCCSAPVVAQTDSGAAQTPQATVAESDGQHDFDFAIGNWKIHLKKLQNPLTGSKTWIEFDGTLSTRKIWVAMAMSRSSPPLVLRVPLRAWLCAYTIRRLVNGASVGPTRRMVLWTAQRRLGGSRMAEESSTVRTRWMVSLSSSDSCGRTRIPIRRILNSLTRRMGARPGK
jgi:hypothetical protein